MIHNVFEVSYHFIESTLDVAEIAVVQAELRIRPFHTGSYCIQL